MTIKCFCDSCGKEMIKPFKALSINISGTTYFPDLCKECTDKVINLIYQHSGGINHDDKE